MGHFFEGSNFLFIFEGLKAMEIVLHLHHHALALDTIIYWQCVLLGDWKPKSESIHGLLLLDMQLENMVIYNTDAEGHLLEINTC